MKIEIKTATLRDLCWTAANAREIDKEEIIASGPRTMQEAGYLTWLALETYGGIGQVAWIDDNPEVAFGFTPVSALQPWLYAGWAWGSDRIKDAMPAMYLWAHRELVEALDRLGVSRIEARSIATHTEAHRWLEWVGFKKECDLVDWGRNRTRFVQYAWVRSEFRGKDRRNVHGITASTRTVAATA